MAWPKEIPGKRYPSDLTDEEWEILEPILKNHSPGAPGLAWTETRVDTRLRRLSGQRPLAYW